MCDRKRITRVTYVRYVVTHFQIRWIMTTLMTR